MSEKIKLPLTRLPSFGVTATTLSYFGWSDEVQDLLQTLSRESRDYWQSHHKECLSNFLVKSRWHMHDAPPTRLAVGNITETDGCEDGDELTHNNLKSWIVQNWNCPKNRSIQSVCQAISNTYMIEAGNGKAGWTYFAMVIKKADYERDK